MKLGPRTPIALAILELLHEHPMHPYEIQHHIRERGLAQVIRLRPASLYSTVERLAAAELIEPVETSRDGRRPLRTVYALTENGLDTVQNWLRELVHEPVQEYPWFATTLAFIAMIPPQELAQLLERRAVMLEVQIAATETLHRNLLKWEGFYRVFNLEGEYLQAMRRAELAWTLNIIKDLQTGELTWSFGPPEATGKENHERRPHEHPDST